MEEKNSAPEITGKKINHNVYIGIGIGIYILGYILLAFIGTNYTGPMSFLAPAFILGGALVLVLGLIF